MIENTDLDNDSTNQIKKRILNNSNDNKEIDNIIKSDKQPIVLKKKRHPLITTLRYIALFLIFFLLTSEYFVQFVHVEGSPLNKGKFSHINKNVKDPRDYNAIRIEYSPNYHEISSDHLYDMLRNKTHDEIPLNSNNNSDDYEEKETTIINHDDSNLKIFKEYTSLEDHYANILSSNSTYILFLYHMDCPYSHRLLPIIETLSRTYPDILFFQSRGFTIILKSHFHTRTTPTLFIRKNDTLIKYKGSKNLNSIKKWIFDNSNNQIPIEGVKPNEDIELSKNIRAERGYLLYFSCAYVLFLVGLSINRWLKKYQKIKVD